MKKIIGILIIMLSVDSYSMKVYDPSNHQENIMQRIESIKQTAHDVTKINNQVSQIKNQLQILKGLSEDIANGNITNLDSFFREINYMLGSYNSILLDSQEIADKYWKLFETDPAGFENQVGFGEPYLKEMERKIGEARKQSNTALYDVMTQQGFAAKIGADNQNLQTLLNASKTGTGVIEVLQVTNSLLGQISTNISKLGVLTETATKAQAMATNTDSQELGTSKKELKKAMETQKLKDEVKMQELINKSKKSIKL